MKYSIYMKYLDYQDFNYWGTFVGPNHPDKQGLTVTEKFYIPKFMYIKHIRLRSCVIRRSRVRLWPQASACFNIVSLVLVLSVLLTYNSKWRTEIYSFTKKGKQSGVLTISIIIRVLSFFKSLILSSEFCQFLLLANVLGIIICHFGKQKGNLFQNSNVVFDVTIIHHEQESVFGHFFMDCVFI